MKLLNTMPKKLRISAAVLCSVIIADSFISITPPVDAKATCVVPAAEFNSWFESGAVSLNGVVKAANSVTFPDVPNCSFYKWTEQMFLWLTSPAPPKYGNAGGRIFDSQKFFDVSPMDADGNRVFIPHKSGLVRVLNRRVAKLGPHRLPVIMEKGTGRLLEIEKTTLSQRGLPMIINSAGKPEEVENLRFDQAKKIVFLGRAGAIIQRPKPILRKGLEVNTIVQKFQVKDVVAFLGASGNTVEVEQGQAGGGEVLMAQNGSLIYYSTTVNEVYAYFRTSFGNNPVPANTKFPTTQSNLNSIISFATANGKTITDPEALAIEIKSSWIEAAGLAEPEKFIRLKGTIPTYDKSNPNLWVPNGQKTVELAMVGMHVVGSTKGHPEMLWGTFEHVNNSPNAAYSYTNTANTTANVAQSTAGTWLFCATNSAGPFNQAHMFVSGNNIESLPSFTVSPSNTLRWKAWGKGESGASSNTEIISINNSVRNQLIDGDVRKNYIQTGTTWTIFGASPTSSNQVGTNRLANTTMETYQQGTSNSSANGSNCFSCHGSNTTFVSHIFEPLKPLF